MNAAVLSIGDELVTGQTVDTNAAWIAQRLLALGATVSEMRKVGDGRAAISRAIVELSVRVELLLISGGLGPTPDDLTREALGDAIAPGKPLELDVEAVARVESWFRRSDRAMPESNRRQAMRPHGATLLDNPHGTAPGIRARLGSCQIVCMPGVPREMKAMFDASVSVIVRPDAGRVIVLRSVHLVGMGESAVAERLGPLLARDRTPRVGTGVSDYVVSLRVYAEGEAEAAARAADATASEIERILGPLCFGRDDTTLAHALGRALLDRRLTACTIESCTGGMIGELITTVAGSSKWYRGGWVTYSNEMKTACVDVPSDVITRFGAVSREAAEAMARGGMIRSGAEIGLSVTGIAGPGGERPSKPAGTVYIGCGRRDSNGAIDVNVRRFRLHGDRGAIRLRASLLAMQLARLSVLGVRLSEPLIGEVVEAGVP